MTASVSDVFATSQSDPHLQEKGNSLPDLTLSEWFAWWFPFSQKGEQHVYYNYRGIIYSKMLGRSHWLIDSGRGVWFSPWLWNGGPDLYLLMPVWGSLRVCQFSLRVLCRSGKGLWPDYWRVLWCTLLEYWALGQFSKAIWSQYVCSESCVCILGPKLNIFFLCVGLRQCCPQSLTVFDFNGRDLKVQWRPVVYLTWEPQDCSSAFRRWCGSVGNV